MRIAYNEELYHFGVRGMKWGIRRYRNEDGTLTEKGKKRYAKMNAKVDKTYKWHTDPAKETLKRSTSSKAAKESAKNTIKREDELRELRRSEIEKGFNFYENRIKNSAIAGAIIAGPIGAGYALVGRHIYEELKRGSVSAREDIYNRYDRQAVAISK